MKIFNIPFIVVLFSLMLISCKDETKKIIENQFITGTINDVSFSASDIVAEIETSTKDNFTSRRLTIRSTVDSGNFQISILNWSWQGLPTQGVKAKKHFTADTDDKQCEFTNENNLTCENADGSIFYSLRNFSTPQWSRKDGYIVISENDTENSVLNGNFDFVCEDGSDTLHFRGTLGNIRY